MDIIKNKEGNSLTVKVVGRLDTNTAPELEKNVNEDIKGVTLLTFNFEELDYISSAGLRVVLMFHKNLTGNKGKLVISHPRDEVMEVFDMTGFSGFLNIEE